MRFRRYQNIIKGDKIKVKVQIKNFLQKIRVGHRQFIINLLIISKIKRETKQLQ